MRKLSLISVSILLFSSCTSVYFTHSQPENYESMNEIPLEFQGNFIDSVSLASHTYNGVDVIDNYFLNNKIREKLIREFKINIHDSLNIIIHSKGVNEDFINESNIAKLKDNLLFLNKSTQSGYELHIIKIVENEKYLITINPSQEFLEDNNFTINEDNTEKTLLRNVTEDQLNSLLLNSEPIKLIEVATLFNNDGSFSDEYFKFIKGITKNYLGGYQYITFMLKE